MQTLFQKYASGSRIIALLGFLRGNQDRIVGGFELVLASLVSMVGLIVLSRLMSIDDFGVLAMALGIWLVIDMLQHSAVITPFIVSCSDPDHNREEFGAWLVWNLLLSFGVSALLFVAGISLSRVLPWMASALMLVSPLTLAGMLYMFVRRVHYQRRSRVALITQTALYCSLYVIGLMTLTLIRPEVVTPLHGAAIIVAAYALPGALFTILAARRASINRGFLARIARSRRLIAEFGAVGVLWEFSQSSALLALGVFSMPASVAVFSITRTLNRPINLCISAVSDADMTRASKALTSQGKAALALVVSGARRALLVTTAPPIVLLLVFPEFFLRLIFGEQYAHATLELQLRTASLLPLIYLMPVDIGLAVLRDTRYLMRANLVGLIAGVAALVAFGLLFRIDATTALISLVLARLVTLPMLLLRFRRLMADDDAETAQEAANA